MFIRHIRTHDDKDDDLSLTHLHTHTRTPINRIYDRVKDDHIPSAFLNSLTAQSRNDKRIQSLNNV